MVVGADHAVVTAPARAEANTAQQLDGPVGEHLVGVHVVADARAGLEWVDPKGVDEPLLERQPIRRAALGGEAQDLVSGPDDGSGKVVG